MAFPLLRVFRNTVFCPMKGTAVAVTIAGLTLMTACSEPKIEKPSTELKWPSIDWQANGKAQIEAAKRRQPNNGIAKNVILFVGDGMGVSTVTAARIFEGQLRGEAGEENLLSFERFPYTSMSKTFNVNQQTPDSAGTASAMMTGIKTRAGVISVTEQVVKGDCASAKDNAPLTLLEMAEDAGLATGVISTASITHATPATTYAHSADRGWESDAKMVPEAIAAGCIDIATQLVNFDHGDGLEVAMGGGRAHFLPKTEADPIVAEKKGLRLDGVNLTDAWLSRFDNSVYVDNKTAFEAVDSNKVDHLLALFDYQHMAFAFEREVDASVQPSLPAMTAKAIDILSKNDKGFFLMVEAGRIDHGHHAGNAYRALTDTVELSEAVKTALRKTSSDDTLILVTADHSHVFTMAGYATRGEPILGVGGHDSNGKAYTTLGYANGPGAVSVWRDDPSDEDTTAPDYKQQALVERKSETHGGEDVVIYGQGPMAHLLGGVVEQNFIFHLMEEASQMSARAKRHQMQTNITEAVEATVESALSEKKVLSEPAASGVVVP